jgi:hypothetical protein
VCECAHCKAGGYTYTEEFKRECLDRYWLAKAHEIMAMPSLASRRAKLNEYREIKPVIAKRLEDIIKAEWSKRGGNELPVQGT